jgi:transposase
MVPSVKEGLMAGMRVERLDHLGIVAGVCQEIGLAAYLDALAAPHQQQVSVGTATVAMILNGLGFSNRRLYLVSQFFATKPVEHLLGPGITAEQLHDDCLGRTLGWLYAHDPTALFAGIARQARQRFGIAARQVHVDTTSFSVSGEYAADEADGTDAQAIAVTYGYSRDHRADLKQWMLALATTRQGDVPLFCQALDGNASDKVSLLAAVEALTEQLRPAEEAGEAGGAGAEAPIFVADSGLYSADNVARLSAAGVRWISRVPDTSHEARAALEVGDEAWQQDRQDPKGTHTARWWAIVAQPPVGERWLMVRTAQGEERAGKTLARQVEKARTQWEKTLWHLRNQRFACEPDARAVLTAHLKTCPHWLVVQAEVHALPKHRRPRRPRKGAAPDHTEWQVQKTLTVDTAAVSRQARRNASFLVATNVLDPAKLTDDELVQTYAEQHSVERGFAFLKDPLFLASSVFVKKPGRIVALSLVMALCLLVYRLAEHRLREQLAATGQTVPTQLKQPTERPTMRWMFQCFEGISLVRVLPLHGPPQQEITGVEPLHEQVIRLLGPYCVKFYELST